MLIVLGDLLADYTLRLPNIAGRLDDLHTVEYLELGPGGATNVAITAARLGLHVGCLGEVGNDLFGRIVIDGLVQEGVDTSAIVITEGARTPVANVLLDDRGEPAYLGYPGSLTLGRVPASWHDKLDSAKALFSDGWAEHKTVPELKLEAFHLVRDAGIPIFFDPGPGNQRIDTAWHQQAIALSTVLLATEEQAQRFSGESDALASAKSILALGPELVIIKRGPNGCILLTQDVLEISAGFPVSLRDTTGAGDSFAGAVIYGYLRNMPPKTLALLANATGAAKVQKLGTGHNMPWPADIQAVLECFEKSDPDIDLSGARRPV